MQVDVARTWPRDPQRMRERRLAARSVTTLSRVRRQLRDIRAVMQLHFRPESVICVHPVLARIALGRVACMAIWAPLVKPRTSN